MIGNVRVEEIIGNDSVERVRLTPGSNIPVAGVFLAVGYDPETALVRGLLELDPMGHIPVDLQMQTTIPGLFAVGTARQRSAGQLASVVGDGVTAAVAAHHYLLTKAA